MKKGIMDLATRLFNMLKWPTEAACDSIVLLSFLAYVYAIYYFSQSCVLYVFCTCVCMCTMNHYFPLHCTSLDYTSSANLIYTIEPTCSLHVCVCAQVWVRTYVIVDGRNFILVLDQPIPETYYGVHYHWHYTYVLRGKRWLYIYVSIYMCICT